MNENEQKQKPETAQTSQAGPAAPDRRETNRRNLVQGFAGAYLLYTTWQLASALAADWPQGAWSAEQIISAAASVIFLAAGVGLLLLVLRRSLRSWKREKKQED